MLTESDGFGLTRIKPIPFNHPFLTQEGYGIAVIGSFKGSDSWSFLKAISDYNEPPRTNKQYLLISLAIRNVSTLEEPELITSSSFSLVGSSNKVIDPYKSISLPKEDELPEEKEFLQELNAELFHGGNVSGSIVFCVPEDETNMCLMWNKAFLYKSSIRYFAVE